MAIDYSLRPGETSEQYATRLGVNLTDPNKPITGNDTLAPQTYNALQQQSAPFYGSTNIPTTPNADTLSQPPLVNSPEDAANLYNQFQSEEQKNLMNEQNNTVSTLKSLIDSLSQKSSDTAALEGQYNIPGQYDNLKSLTNLAATKLGEVAAAVPENVAAPGASLSFAQGKAAFIRAQKVADLTLVQAQVQAAQGNIQLATQLVDRAINQKYQSIEDRIKATENYLQINQGRLNDTQKADATKLQIYLDQQKQKLQDQKSLESQYFDMYKIAPDANIPNYDSRLSASENFKRAAAAIAQSPSFLQKGDAVAQRLEIAAQNAQTAETRAGFYAILSQLNIQQKTNVAAGQLVRKDGLPISGNTAAVSQVSALKSVLDETEDIKQLLAKGIQTGAVKGWINREGVEVPILQDTVSPELAGLQQRLINHFLQVVYAQSGKQINDTELKLSSVTNPSTLKPPAINAAIIDAQEQGMRIRLNSLLETYGWKFGDTTTGVNNDVNDKDPLGLGL